MSEMFAGQAVRHRHIERLTTGYPLEVIREIEKRLQRHEALERQQLVDAPQNFLPRLFLAGPSLSDE